MPPTNHADTSPDIDEIIMLAALQRSMEDAPKSIDHQEQYFREKYASLLVRSTGHQLDNNFRSLNDVITLSRSRKKDKGPCMLLDDSDEEKVRRSRASRSSSPGNISGSKRLKSKIDDSVMTITPARRRPIPSDSDDDQMAGSPKTPQKYGGIDSYDHDMAGSPKTPQDYIGSDGDGDDDDELADFLYEIGQNDDVVFCGFANDSLKCYRNSLLWVLLSCDKIIDEIRKHKNNAQALPCSDFDDFLLQLYEKCQHKTHMSIDEEFKGSNCLKVNDGSGFGEQSPMEYLSLMFDDDENMKTMHVTKELMSYRILHSIERKKCDGSVTWRSDMLKYCIFSESCNVIDETAFNNISSMDIQASGLDVDAVATLVNVAVKLPKIWCIDAASGLLPKFKQEFTLSIPQQDQKQKISRAVYRIIGCVSRSTYPRHYVACIFKNKQWVCMVF